MCRSEWGLACVLSETNKKKQKLEDRKGLSGKGRLTLAGIQKLQTFYGLAIRRNTHNLDAMRKAVWSTYCHVKSSNENVTHHMCPTDDTTWCKYQKALIENKTYDHNKHFHLPEVVMLKIKSIFGSLAKPELLSKCLKGKSQNPNESLNKRTFVQLPTLKFGAYDAVLSFNEGFEHLGLEIGTHLFAAMKRMDLECVQKAEKAASDLEKKIRQSRTLNKRRLEDIYQEAEDPDNPSYGAGLH